MTMYESTAKNIKYPLRNSESNESTYSKDSVDVIPNTYEKMVHLLRKFNLIKDNRIGNKILRMSFKGDDLVQWLIQEKKIKRYEALEIGQQIVLHYFANENDSYNFSADKYYQLKEHDEFKPLNNAALTIECVTTNVKDYNNILCSIMRPLLKNALSIDKKCILLERLEDNPDFEKYVEFIKQAICLDIENATRQEKLALFVNIYNMMSIHVTYNYGIPLTIWQKRWSNNSVYYRIGNYLYSLQSILNGILRGNQKGIDLLWEPFGENDPRKIYMLEKGECLIHFAINSLNKSTPPIKLYSCENVYEEMIENARRCFLDSEEFLSITEANVSKNSSALLNQNKNEEIIKERSTIGLSKTFKKYSSDFAENSNQIIPWILHILPNNSKKKAALFKVHSEKNYSIIYLPYDFETNVVKTMLTI